MAGSRHSDTWGGVRWCSIYVTRWGKDGRGSEQSTTLEATMDWLYLLWDLQASKAWNTNNAKGGAGGLITTVNPARGCKDKGTGASDTRDERLKEMVLVRFKQEKLQGTILACTNILWEDVKRLSQTLLSGILMRSKRQWTEIEIEKNPLKSKKNHLCSQ